MAKSICSTGMTGTYTVENDCPAARTVKNSVLDRYIRLQYMRYIGQIWPYTIPERTFLWRHVDRIFFQMTWKRERHRMLHDSFLFFANKITCHKSCWWLAEFLHKIPLQAWLRGKNRVFSSFQEHYRGKKFIGIYTARGPWCWFCERKSVQKYKCTSLQWL